jgi:type I restriction enzyme S subunit
MKENWTYKKLGEVTSFVKDGDWIESRYQSENGIRLIQTGNVGNGFFKAKEDKPHYISEETFKELGCTEIYSGDCLVSRLPEPIGRACIIPDVNYRMITAVDCTIIRFKDIMSPQLFVYYTKSKEYEREINNHTTGTTRKRISRKNLESVCVPVPPISEQKHIVSELDLLQSIINKQQAQLKELDKLAQAVFYDMFGDPVENEKGWILKTMEDVCLNIVDCPHSTPKKSNRITNYPCIRTSELKDGSICWDSMQYLEEDEYIIRIARLKPIAGDIVFGREGTIGDAVILPDGYSFSLGQRTMLLRVDSSSISNVFLQRVILSECVKKQIRMVNVSSTVPHVNIKDFKQFEIPVPPLSLQQSFATKIESIEKQKAAISQSIAETQKLFDYTMDKYFG